MKHIWKILGLLAFISILFITCYYPVEIREKAQKGKLIEGKETKVATKMHLTDGSVILCYSGFALSKDTLHATGLRFPFAHEQGFEGLWSIPLDSLVGLEYFDKDIRGVRGLGTVLLGATVAGEVGIAGIVILKAIFGSCPTVYSFDGERQHLEAESFSYSIGRMFEGHDLDRINQRYRDSSHVTLRVKNEALETHYIDMMRLCYVDHPGETEVFSNDDGDILMTSHPIAPTRAVTSENRDVTKEIAQRDGVVYTIDSATAGRMLTSGSRDWIECEVPIPANASTVTIAIRAKNSLQNTVLLYDVMMRDQGLDAMDWSESVNENLWYAWRLGGWYKEFSGIELLVKDGEEFVPRGRISDTGPIAWKDVAARITLGKQQDTLRMRLQFLPDNWIIDWVGFDFSDAEPLTPSYASCVGVMDNFGNQRSDVVVGLGTDDEHYAVTYPGEWLDLTFSVPASQDKNRTFFLQSDGYYVEWVRPEWIGARDHVTGFDFSDRQVVMKRLAELWVAKKNTFEQQFFDQKIPSWEVRQ